MSFRKPEDVLDAASIGGAYLWEQLLYHLAPFPGNGLYSRRGKPPMKKYKTVSEVCALTGLTRKHLYYFHHANIVRATDYANYSVEGHVGYKLYDDVAVEKLCHIALYYHLGLKRNEIKDIMLDPSYDSNRVLETLREQALYRRACIDNHLKMIEVLQKSGTKNGMIGIVLEALVSVSEYPEEALHQGVIDAYLTAALERANLDAFALDFEDALVQLTALSQDELLGVNGTERVGEMIKIACHYLGLAGYLMVAGLFMSATGEGTIARMLSPSLLPVHGEVGQRYINNTSQYMRGRLEEIVAENSRVIGLPYEDPAVEALLCQVKDLLHTHYGIQTKEDYQLIFGYLHIEHYKFLNPNFEYILQVLKHHCLRLQHKEEEK